jgi:hypothetical protein
MADNSLPDDKYNDLMDWASKLKDEDIERARNASAESAAKKPIAKIGEVVKAPKIEVPEALDRVPSVSDSPMTAEEAIQGKASPLGPNAAIEGEAPGVASAASDVPVSPDQYIKGAAPAAEVVEANPAISNLPSGKFLDEGIN